jgi:CubicO group peptidase (beta-lactamase class C family)
MGITKFLVSIILAVFVGFPMGVGSISTDVKDSINTTTTQAEVFSLSSLQVHVIDSLLQRRLKRNGFRGAALVSYKNQILMEYAHGYADYRSKEKIQVQSTFQLASVSKSFTAASIMVLKEKGLLEFDDLVQKHIAEFPYDNITIKQLLQHTSGLQNYMYLVDNYWKNDSIISNEDVLGLLIKYKLPLNNRPGRRFIYSNTGYAMLALVVERVAHQSFAEFVEENVFKPSGMNSTFTYSHAIMDTLTNRVIGYNRKGRRLYRYDFEPNDMILGDKSVYSNVIDLFLYQKALNSYQIVQKSTLDEAYTKGETSRYHRSFNYGFGWRLKNENGNDLVYHNGLWHGFTSTLTRDMSSDITVILLNNTTGSISSIKMDLLNIAKKELKIILESEQAETNIALVNIKEAHPKS